MTLSHRDGPPPAIRGDEANEIISRALSEARMRDRIEQERLEEFRRALDRDRKWVNVPLLIAKGVFVLGIGLVAVSFIARLWHHFHK